MLRTMTNHFHHRVTEPQSEPQIINSRTCHFLSSVSLCLCGEFSYPALSFAHSLYNNPVSATPSFAPEEVDPASGRPPFTRWQDLLLTLISWATTIAVRLIGPTMKFRVSCTENSPTTLEGPPVGDSFRPQSTFPA